MKLKLSKDRKVTNLVMPSGKQAKIANTLGLPSGKMFSCPGETSVCSKVCYASKIERIFPSARKLLLHNWELLKDASYSKIRELLGEAMFSFNKECEKHSAKKLFRIHFSGDFFNEVYTEAWRDTVTLNKDIHFWAYTRSSFAVPILSGIDNLSLYFSTDSDNSTLAKEISGKYNVKLAILDETFSRGQVQASNLLNKGAVKCPENNKKIPLISKGGSACGSCLLCVRGKNDVLFSISKK